jgi:hypothetical protein
MLFDLRGRRRRVVQFVYLSLALLMGGGLVLFGIGGDVTGGLFDAFSDRGGGGNPNSVLEQRVERLEKRVQANPDDQEALQSLVRDYFNLALASQEAGQARVPAEGRDELRRSAAAWQRYVDAADGEPSASTARFALQVYDVGALNQPAEAQEAAAIIARSENDSASYLQLVAYASLAKDKRTADLATTRAVDLAPKGQRKTVEQQAKQLKKQSAQQVQQQAPSG